VLLPWQGYFAHGVKKAIAVGGSSVIQWLAAVTIILGLLLPASIESDGDNNLSLPHPNLTVQTVTQSEPPFLPLLSPYLPSLQFKKKS